MINKYNFDAHMDALFRANTWLIEERHKKPEGKTHVVRMEGHMDRVTEEAVRGFLCKATGLHIEKYWPEGDSSTRHFLVHLNFRKQHRPERLPNPLAHL